MTILGNGMVTVVDMTARIVEGGRGVRLRLYHRGVFGGVVERWRWKLWICGFHCQSFER